MTFRVLCPAKINTFLAVGPLDESGYHPIRSIFQAISLSDAMLISDKGEPGIACVGFDLPAENTISKALRFVKELVDVPPLRIVLQKAIPAESGLGGGSSDAGALLRAINHFLIAPLNENQLADCARAIGADVPFFLIGGRAQVEGYGEKVMPLPDREQSWLAVAKPQIGSSTVAAYAALDRLEFSWRDFTPDDKLYNDFERVAPCESLDLIERLLEYGARDAGLTGSGAAVYGRFEGQEQASLAVEHLEQRGTHFVTVAHTLSRSESLSIQQISDG